MWTCGKWKDYELIEATDGERLERWGEFILIRPDPQVIWSLPRKSPLWEKADGIYRKRGGGGSWVKADMPESWTVSYEDYVFRIRPMNFKHTGIFPEQAPNWEFESAMIKNALKNPERFEGGRPQVLNLFAYTGAATVACAAAGAFVCHVDASKGMVGAAKENVKLSGIDDFSARYIVDDCIKFVEREIRRGRRYDAVIMDPPSYGRGPGGEVWKIEECVFDLVKSAVALLSDKPLFFLINSYTTGLSPLAMEYMLRLSLGEKGKKGTFESGETGIPVSDTGLVLPSGSCVRFSCNIP